MDAITRARLDEIIAALSRLSPEVSLDQFRTAVMRNSLRAAARLRAILFICTAVFLAVLFFHLAVRAAPICGEIESRDRALWALALGGLGAVSSIFLGLTDLSPTLPASPISPFFAIVRITLGCIFSVILYITVVPTIEDFIPKCMDHDVFRGSAKNGLLSLSPFLFGFSIELVLKILDNASQSILAFFGGAGRSNSSPERPSRRRQRRTI